MDNKKTNGAIKYIRQLLKRKWMTPWEIQAALRRNPGKLYSESTITARIRDLRKPEFGDHNLLIRRRKGSSAQEYRIQDEG